MPVSPGMVVKITPMMSPSVMRRMPQPIARTRRISSSCRGRSMMRTVMSFGSTPLALASARDVLLGRCGRDRRCPADSPGRSRSCPCRRRAPRAACRPRPSPSRRSSPACPWRRASCPRADRPRCRPSGPSPVPTRSPMKSIGRLVALALADHDRAVDRQRVQLAPHRVDRRLVGRLLLAAPAQPRRRDRRALGHADEFERQDALDDSWLLGMVGSWSCRTCAPHALLPFSERRALDQISRARSGSPAAPPTRGRRPRWRRARRGSRPRVAA